MFEILSGFHLISQSFNATVTAYQEHLSAVSFCSSIQSGESIIGPPRLKFIL